MLKDKNIISSKEAAAILGVTTVQVRRLIEQGKIYAERFDERTWMIDRDSVLEYKRQRHNDK